MKLLLADIAHARSGDKANCADISLLAWDQLGYDLLCQHLSIQRVAQHFAHLLTPAPLEQQVSVYYLPRLYALKWLLHGALDGGAASSLRSDNLGKTIAAQLLRLELDLPADQATAALSSARQAQEQWR